MVSIRRQLTVMFFGCASLTAILIYYFVNVTICSQIDEYMMENQEKRNERLVTYFEDYYQKNRQFSSDAGSELMHEAYMNQFWFDFNGFKSKCHLGDESRFNKRR